MNEAERLAKSLEAGDRSGMWYPSMEAAAELRRLSAELEKVRKNAERYRWLRDIAGMGERDSVSVYCGNDFDGSIDAAMKGQQ